MCSVDYLRAMISDRLSVAAGEIFTEFEKTIVQYQKEIDRQRRLLDVVWKPHIPLQSIELPQSYVCENEKTLIDHQPHDQERKSVVDNDDPDIKDEQEELCTSLVQSNSELPQIKSEEEEFCSNLNQSNTELPLIKTEQEELCSSEKEEQLGLKQETDNFVVTPAYEESDHSEPKPSSDQLLFHISCAAKSPDQEGSKDVDSGSTGRVKLKPRHKSTSSHSNDVDNAPMTERQCDNDKETESRTCVICGKAFGRKSDLTRHYRTHTGEKPYSCDICGKRFTEKGTLTVHMRCHTGEKPYSCDTCGKSFSQLFHMKSHMRSHTGERPYVCNTCGKRFSDNGNLRVHMRIHTGEKPYSCDTCGKGFSENGNLRVHMRRHTGEKPYSCDTCGKGFSDNGTLKIHMRRHTELPQSYVCENEKTLVDHQPHDQERKSVLDNDDPDIKDEQELPQIKSEEEEFCTNLNQSNTELPLIKTEQEELCSSEKEEQLGLKQETDNFVVTPAYEESDHSEPKPSSDQLLFHISCAAKSLDQEGSKDVDSGSTGPVKLKPRHKSTSSHSNDVDNAPMTERQCDIDKATKSQICDVCGKSFRRKSDLTRHYRIHTGEKPYSCDICGKRFTDNGTLNVHMRCHTGEKPYSCDTCGKSFSQLFHMKSHMRCHTGERPYVCNTCGKRFTRKSIYYRHREVHKKERHVLVEHVEKAWTAVAQVVEQVTQ